MTNHNAAWTCWRNPAHEVGTHPVFGWPQCKVCSAAPPYHERPDYLPEGLLLRVYVPSSASNWKPARGSGIVGVPNPAMDHATVHYEGWIYGQHADLDPRRRWELAVQNAAGRMVTDYPTIAQVYVGLENLVPIGHFDPRSRVITVDDEQALAAWLGGQS